MLGHGAGIGYTGLGPRMGPTDNFSLMTGPPPRTPRGPRTSLETPGSEDVINSVSNGVISDDIFRVVSLVVIAKLFECSIAYTAADGTTVSQTINAVQRTYERFSYDTGVARSLCDSSVSRLL